MGSDGFYYIAFLRITHLGRSFIQSENENECINDVYQVAPMTSRLPTPDSRLQLDTLKIIKRLQAIFALVMRFARGGSKDAHHGGVLGVAVGAGDDFVFA